MIQAQNEKHLNVTPPQALVNNGSVTCGLIDTQGFTYAKIVVQLGATDIALSTLKIQEADAQSAGSLSSPVDIVGTRFGTDNNADGNASTLPSATDDNHLFSFYLDLRIRKRYLQPVIAVGDGTSGAYVAVLAELSLAQTFPSSAAGRGNTQDVIV